MPRCLRAENMKAARGREVTVRAEVIKELRSGDAITVSGHRVGEKPRLGEVIEVLGEEGHEHLLVRWDNGEETIFYPAEDATIERAPHAKREEVR